MTKLIGSLYRCFSENKNHAMRKSAAIDRIFNKVNILEHISRNIPTLRLTGRGIEVLVGIRLLTNRLTRTLHIHINEAVAVPI